jgi:tetratricopeptide (TPR) repeat protein
LPVYSASETRDSLLISVPADLKPFHKRRVTCLLLVLLTLALYWPVTDHRFINFDDDQYVTGNFHVNAGLTWSGIVWAFQSGYAHNWHPLTWISHMLDCQLFRLNPAGHHLTNLLFHIANTVLLFLFLSRTTATIWRSGFVAALFACHPVHVESVAWVAERKDVLSTFFWMLTLLAYARFVEESKARSPKPKVPTQKSKVFYIGALLAFACGLMSKPMVVTLPFVLLLLDFWPLQRLNASTFPLRLVEKIPFFALALGSSALTFLVQRGAVAPLDTLPFSFRITNAMVSYLRYVSKSFWPVDLAILYPIPALWSPELVFTSILFVLACSVLFIWLARRYPYLFVGWFWYLGTLIPVIGLVQVGMQSMADRYLYIPGIGLFLLMVWGFNALSVNWPQRKWIAAGTGIAVVVGCTVVCRAQLQYWQNSITLFSRAKAVTPGNYVIDNHLGEALDESGQLDKAILVLQESVRINPYNARGLSELGTALAQEGNLPEAIEAFRKAVQLRPNDAVLRYDLGAELLENGQLDEAATELLTALQLNPNFAAAHRSLAAVLLKRGETAEALNHFAEAVHLSPGWADAHFDYGLALLNNNQPADAAAQFSRMVALVPDQAKGHYRLAQALFLQHQSQEAIDEFWKALRLDPESPGVLNELAWILATNPDSKFRSGTVAIHLAERACSLTHYQEPAMLTTLGVAYAEAGRFPEAIKTAQQARDLASAEGQKDLVGKNQLFLKLYQSQRPYRQPM